MAIVWVYAMVRVDPTLSTLTIESAIGPPVFARMGTASPERRIGGGLWATP